MTVDFDNDDAHSFAGHRLCRVRESLWGDPARTTHPHVATVDGAGESVAGVLLNVDCLVAFRCGCGDGFSEGVAAGGL